MNRIEQLIEQRREWDSRLQVPFLRIAALGLLAVILACMVVVLFLLQTWEKALPLIVIVLGAGWPAFVLGRRHARRRLIRRPGPGNI